MSLEFKEDGANWKVLFCSTDSPFEMGFIDRYKEYISNSGAYTSKELFEIAEFMKQMETMDKEDLNASIEP